MLRYILRKLVLFLISLLVSSLVIFAVLEVIPGDPAQFMLGIGATEATLAALRHELGLDVAPHERYLNWIGGMLRGISASHTPTGHRSSKPCWNGSPCRCHWR